MTIDNIALIVARPSVASRHQVSAYFRTLAVIPRIIRSEKKA